jgi:hypothetical protein
VLWPRRSNRLYLVNKSDTQSSQFNYSYTIRPTNFPLKMNVSPVLFRKAFHRFQKLHIERDGKELESFHDEGSLASDRANCFL